MIALPGPSTRVALSHTRHRPERRPARCSNSPPPNEPLSMTSNSTTQITSWVTDPRRLARFHTSYGALSIQPSARHPQRTRPSVAPIFSRTARSTSDSAIRSKAWIPEFKPLAAITHSGVLVSSSSSPRPRPSPCTDPSPQTSWRRNRDSCANDDTVTSDPWRHPRRQF